MSYPTTNECAVAAFTIPVKCFNALPDPYGLPKAPHKVRFFVNVRDIPAGLTEWMATNPREQNLGSSVAKAIKTSVMQDSHDFHLKNRGCLFSAQKVDYLPAPGTPSASDGVGAPGEGRVTMAFTDSSKHGNIDGGHTLRLLLAAQEDKALPEQYVEFEVIVGAQTILDIAEARNTSVALDMRTMEGMKGSYTVLQHILGDAVIGSDRFFDRVEMKMNEQLDETNSIDIRLLISILLMFNQDLYPVVNGEGKRVMLSGRNDLHPVQMYGGKEAALKKYLELGDGDPEERDRKLMAMSPILLDIFKLWDVIERELPQIKPKKYQAYAFTRARKNAHTLFSNESIDVYTPQSIIFPILAAFRCLVAVSEDGTYSWRYDPFEMWEKLKTSLFSTLDNEMKQTRGNYNGFARRAAMWAYYYSAVLLETIHRDVEQANQVTS